jgi:hypothetical protein
VSTRLRICTFAYRASCVCPPRKRRPNKDYNKNYLKIYISILCIYIGNTNKIVPIICTSHCSTKILLYRPRYPAYYLKMLSLTSMHPRSHHHPNFSTATSTFLPSRTSPEQVFLTARPMESGPLATTRVFLPLPNFSTILQIISRKLGLPISSVA